ncbi:MAG TPA: hypothetical protein VHB73_03670, partial [Alphaproteobacteria bacterium]|nr:hypothetical protein [Alphaproteobacteria bacterium]
MSADPYARMEHPPALNGAEPLPGYFHLPLQQYALRQIPEADRALLPHETSRWNENILLSYILGHRSEPMAQRTPRLLTPELTAHLNAVDEPEEELPATRLIKLLCEQVSPFDRMTDLNSKAGRRRFYLDFVLLHNLSSRLPPELFPDFIWRHLNETNPTVPQPEGLYPLSYALTHIWRKLFQKIPFQPEDAAARAQFLGEFIQLHSMAEMDMRLITPELLRASSRPLPPRAGKVQVPFVVAPPAAIQRP